MENGSRTIVRKAYIPAQKKIVSETSLGQSLGKSLGKSLGVLEKSLA